MDFYAAGPLPSRANVPVLTREATLSCQDSLLEATKQDDILVLRRAVANAHQAGYHGASLELADVKLEKLCAKETLMIAMNMPESGALKSAILRAQLRGLGEEDHCNKLLLTAERILDQLEVKKALSVALKEHSGERDRQKLQEVVQKARTIKFHSKELDQAKEILRDFRDDDREAGARAEEVPLSADAALAAEIRDVLKVAMNLFETGGLRDAIKRATANFIDVPELHKAKYMLAKIEAKRQLEAAIRGKLPDAKKLKEALVVARGCRMENDLTVQARSLLEGIQARDELSAAISSRTPERLQQAIVRAQMAKVDQSKIMKADGILEQIYTAEAAEAEKAGISRRHKPAQTLPPEATQRCPMVRGFSFVESSGSLSQLGNTLTGSPQARKNIPRLPVALRRGDCSPTASLSSICSPNSNQPSLWSPVAKESALSCLLLACSPERAQEAPPTLSRSPSSMSQHGALRSTVGGFRFHHPGARAVQTGVGREAPKRLELDVPSVLGRMAAMPVTTEAFMPSSPAPGSYDVKLMKRILTEESSRKKICKRLLIEEDVKDNRHLSCKRIEEDI